MSTGSISTLGIGSGIDISSILEQLREVDQQPIDAKEEEIEELELLGSEIDEISLSLLNMRTSALDLSMGSNFTESEITTSGSSVDAESVADADDVTHTVNVEALATYSTWISEGVSSETAIVSTGDMSFSYHLGEDGTEVSLTVEAGTTLEDLVTLINEDDANPGVTASIVDTGIGDEPYKLVLKSDDSGEESRIFIDTQLLSTAMESDQSVTISETEPLEMSAASGNNEIVFQERVGDGTLGEALTATIADGSYSSGDDLAAAIETAMEDASENGIDYTVTYNSDTETFSIEGTESDGGETLEEVSISWGDSSAASALGFDDEDDTYKPQMGIALTESTGADGENLNAQFTVDGIDYQRQSNDDIEDVINGIGLDLLETGSSTISVAPDYEIIETRLLEIIDALNGLTESLDENSSYDTDTEEKGILFGKTSITRIDDDIIDFLEQTVSTDGEITSLYDLGLTVEEDGTLSLDTSVLEEALEENAEDVILFFTGDSDTGEEGFGDLLYEKIKSYTDSDGLLTAEGDAVQTKIEKLEEEIENDTALLDKRYDTLTAQYIAMDSYIQEMESQASYMEQIFGASSDDD